MAQPVVSCPTQDEIEACERLLKEKAALLPPDEERMELLVLPIYAALPPEQQMKVFQPAPKNTRKVRALSRACSLQYFQKLIHFY